MPDFVRFFNFRTVVFEPPSNFEFQRVLDELKPSCSKRVNVDRSLNDSIFNPVCWSIKRSYEI